MLLSFDVEANVIDEHDRWHTQEHLPERLSIPGFRRGSRWTAIEGAPRYMVLYEVENLETLSSAAYLARLNNPTPWTSKLMPHYRGMRRGLCAVIGSFGHGHGGTAALLRFTPSDRRAVHRWLLEEILPSVPQTPGFGSAHLLQGAQAAAMTSEQRIRGADGGIDSAIIATGYDRHAVSAFAAKLCATDGLPAHGAADIASATYALGYSLTPQDK